MTHAFFKALLFLGAGSVIHAMSDEQDIRKMGGIWRLIPVTYADVDRQSGARRHLPFFAGYYSKDMILEAAYAAHTGVGMFAFWLGIAAAFLTAFYSWRLILMTFHGGRAPTTSVMARVHEIAAGDADPDDGPGRSARRSPASSATAVRRRTLAPFWTRAILVLPTSTPSRLRTTCRLG